MHNHEAVHNCSVSKMKVFAKIARQQQGWSLDESKRAERYAKHYFTGMVETMDTIAVANIITLVEDYRRIDSQPYATPRLARAGGPRPKVKIGGSWGMGPRQGSRVTCSSVDVPYITPRAASKALRLWPVGARRKRGKQTLLRVAF